MARPGQGAPAGYRVVDRVQARCAEVTGVGGKLLLGAEPRDHVIQPRQQFFRFQVDVGEGLHGGPQSAHGGSRVDAMACHVADDQADPAAGQPDHVEPVAAHGHAGM